MPELGAAYESVTDQRHRDYDVDEIHLREQLIELNAKRIASANGPYDILQLAKVITAEGRRISALYNRR